MKKILIPFFILTSSFVISQNLTISGGSTFSVALASDGTVYTWGSNELGQLGRGTIGTDDPIPASVVGLPVNIQLIDAGSAAHVVAVDCNGEVWTWGYNEYGQLGNVGSVATGNSTKTPIHVLKGVTTSSNAFLQNVTYVSSNTTTSYAILNTGNVVAWGAMTTIPGTYDPTVPGHGLNVAGQNQGELGNGTFVGSTTPVYVTSSYDNQPLKNIVAVDGGDEHCFALDAFGNVWAWGGNEYCDPGNCQPGVELGGGAGNSHRKNRAVKVVTSTGAFLSGIIMITAGDTHGLFLKKDGTVWSVGGDWGPGQRGNSTAYDWEDFAKPVASGEQKTKGDITGNDTLKGATFIAAGQQSSWAVVDVDGDGLGYLMAWGANTIAPGSPSFGSGILGRGVTSTYPDGQELPVYVYKSGTTLLNNVLTVSDGDGMGFAEVYNATTRERELYVWGNNNAGQLGTGDKVQRLYPTKPNLIFDIADPCPTIELNTNALTICPSSPFTLDGNATYNKYSHYLWSKDNVQFGINDTSSVTETFWVFDPTYDKSIQSFTGPGTYKLTAIDNRATLICNKQCPTVSDQIVVTAPTPPFVDTGNLSYCFATNEITTANVVASNGIFDWYWSSTGGAKIATSINSANISNSISTISQPYNPADSSITLWVVNVSNFSATAGLTDALCAGLSSTGDRVPVLFTVYSDITLDEVTVIQPGKGWAGSDAYNIKIWNNNPIGMWNGTTNVDGKGTLKTTIPTKAAWTFTYPPTNTKRTFTGINTVLTNTNGVAGTKYWLSVEGGDILYMNCLPSPAFPLNDNSGYNTLQINKSTFDNSPTTSYGSVLNIQFNFGSSYLCGRLPVKVKNDCITSTNNNTVLENIVLSPNPTNNNPTITFQEFKSKQATIKIYNAYGSIINTSTIYDITPNSTYEIDMQNIPQGLYFIEVQANNKKQINKLIKIN